MSACGPHIGLSLRLGISFVCLLLVAMSFIFLVLQLSSCSVFWLCMSASHIPEMRDFQKVQDRKEKLLDPKTLNGNVGP